MFSSEILAKKLLSKLRLNSNKIPRECSVCVCLRIGSNSCENEIATSLADLSKISSLKHINKL